MATNYYAPHPSLSQRASTSELMFDLDDQNTPVVLDKNCDQVRNRLRVLVDRGEYRVKDIIAELGVSANSYRRFMTQSGPDKGSGSDAYIGGLQLLARRAENGLTDPRRTTTAVPRRKAHDDNAAQSKVPRRSRPGAGVVDVSDIVLAGQDTDTVPVYETPREVRRKIALFMRRAGVTQAAFLRALAAQLNTETRTFQGIQLSRFRERSGVDSGLANPVFYAAYVYLEKLRIKEGKPKSKHREEMEKIWADNDGLDTGRASFRDTRLWCHADQQPYVDEYGRQSFLPMGL